MSAMELYGMAADASVSLQYAKQRLEGLILRYGDDLEYIPFTPILGNESTDFDEAVRGGIDLLSELIGMADKAMNDIDEQGGADAVDRDAAIEAAADARVGR